MIDLLLEHLDLPGGDRKLERALVAHDSAVRATAGRDGAARVRRAERAVSADPAHAFRFDAQGFASLQVEEGVLPAGRFSVPGIGELRRDARARRGTHAPADVRLVLMDGTAPSTDIGALQAHAGPGTLFQVASQYNCLEAPDATIVPVVTYFTDPTQGPRAAISAWTGTLLRHYAAPGAGGRRFVQQADGPQLNLLEAVCGPGGARMINGYLLPENAGEEAGFAQRLEASFDALRVGLHEDLPVMLGYNWNGSVPG